MPRTAHFRRRAFLAMLALGMLMPRSSSWAQSPKIDAPNVVSISSRLVTSGQPTAAALARLSEQGFGAVIYLAPPTVPDAVRGEAAIIEKQGMTYVNIPIKFNNPTEADFESFVAALARVADRRVLVHCQVNMRASSFVFLHRVIHGKKDPDKAYESVTKVWAPEGPWKDLIIGLLRKNRIAFEPY